MTTFTPYIRYTKQRKSTSYSQWNMEFHCLLQSIYQNQGGSMPFELDPPLEVQKATYLIFF